MFKRISTTLAIVLLMAVLFTQPIFAAVLEADEANVKFDNYQEGGEDGGYLPNKMFWNEPIGEGTRYSSHVNPDAATDLEVGAPVLVNGSGTNSVVVPFKQTVDVSSFNIRFINGGRQYFFVAYASMDGNDWTEINVTGNAKKGTVDPTCGEGGFETGPAADVYVTTPAGSDDEYGTALLNLGFAAPVTANYIKITFYGNDSETGDLVVGNQWVSFNSLSFEGEITPEAPAVEVEEAAATVVVVDAPAVVVEAPAVAPAPVAPQTGNTSIVLAVILTLTGLAVSAMITKKRSAVK